MSLQLYRSLGKVARTSLNHARLSNPNFYGSSLSKPGCLGVNQQISCISTSNKKSETIASNVTDATTPVKVEAEPNKPPKKKYWISQGFSLESEEEDLSLRNLVMFLTTTVVMVGVGFVFLYMPSPKFRDWVHREGFIELARREALGLPLIDENLIPLEDIHLPTDEELGDFDIII